MNPLLRSARPTFAVTVEYTARGVRVTKEFPDEFAARRFYTAKYKAGAAPKIVSAVVSPR